jgi:hypothetical protein
VYGDNVAAAKTIKEAYEAKWGAQDVDSRVDILNFVLQHEGNGTPLTWAEAKDVFDALPAHNKCDRYGVSLALCKLWFSDAPIAAMHFLSHLLGSTPHLA